MELLADAEGVHDLALLVAALGHELAVVVGCTVAILGADVQDAIVADEGQDRAGGFDELFALLVPLVVGKLDGFDCVDQCLRGVVSLCNLDAPSRPSNEASS